MPSIEVDGIVWESPLKGYLEVTGDDGQVTKKLYLRLAIPKGSTKEEPAYVDVCMDDMPDHVYIECLAKGAGSLLTRGKGYTSLKGAKTPQSTKLAMEAVASNLEAMYRGEIRVTAGAKTKINGAVRTLAMQKARALIRDAIKRAGEKVSLYNAREITQAAEMALAGEHGPRLIQEAKDEIDARNKKDPIIDIGFLQKDPKLVAADQEKKAEKAKKESKPKVSLAALAQRAEGGVHVTHRQ